MQKYTLMHKDVPCAEIMLDENAGHILKLTPRETEYMPFFGVCDLKKMNRWWSIRAIPASRQMIQRLIQTSDVTTPESFLAKNLALSVTDTYWIRPDGMNLSYDDVSLFHLGTEIQTKIPYHNATSYNPNASLGGQMEKYWDFSLDDGKGVLVKESYKHHGQQAVNEVFATELHRMQKTDIPFVSYEAEKVSDGGFLCKCHAFTSPDVEFVSAYELIESAKIPNDTNLYHAYIDIAAEYGADRELMRKALDYQTLSDFAISNTDEHLLNFGVLRDANTMKVTGPAPIFDSGNSMYYTEQRSKPYTKAELLARTVTSFYKTEEKMLSNVTDKGLLHLERLPGKSFVMEFYAKAGLPEEKAVFIAENFETKKDMLYDFQHGMTISLYHEKQAERQIQRQTQEKTAKQRFVMIAGLPDIGKRNTAQTILQQMKAQGYQIVPAKNLYPAEQADKDNPWYLNVPDVLNKLTPSKSSDTRQAAWINPEDVRAERAAKHLPPNDGLVFATVMARIRQAAINGMDIVYSATNLDARQRETVLSATQCKKELQKELIIMYGIPDAVKDDPAYHVMAQKLHDSLQNSAEEWDKVTGIGKDPIMAARAQKLRNNSIEEMTNDGDER